MKYKLKNCLFLANIAGEDVLVPFGPGAFSMPFLIDPASAAVLKEIQSGSVTDLEETVRRTEASLGLCERKVFRDNINKLIRIKWICEDAA